MPGIPKLTSSFELVETLSRVSQRRLSWSRGVPKSDNSMPLFFTSPRFVSRELMKPVDGATEIDCSMSLVVLL
ncbi:hypothetical protein D3C83_50580 [compost metagenome]